MGKLGRDSVISYPFSVCRPVRTLELVSRLWDGRIVGLGTGGFGGSGEVLVRTSDEYAMRKTYSHLHA